MTLSPSVLGWKARQPNGKIPLNELEEIPGTYDVDLRGKCMFMPEAARSFNAMREKMRDDTGLNLSPSRTYRTYAMQEEKWANSPNNPNARPPYGNLAARPGTSNHGEGLAGDMGFGEYSDPKYKWLQKHGQEYGWHNNDAAGEPWHWDYEGDHAPRFNFKDEEPEMTPEQKAKLDEAYRYVHTLIAELGAATAAGAAKKTANKIQEPQGNVAAHEHIIQGKAV